MSWQENECQYVGEDSELRSGNAHLAKEMAKSTFGASAALQVRRECVLAGVSLLEFPKEADARHHQRESAEQLETTGDAFVSAVHELPSATHERLVQFASHLRHGLPVGLAAPAASEQIHWSRCVTHNLATAPRGAASPGGVRRPPRYRATHPAHR